jgi:hypothetical protein
MPMNVSQSMYAAAVGAAINVCLLSKSTTWTARLASIFSFAADFITVGYAFTILITTTHDRFLERFRDAPRGVHDGLRISRPDASPPLFD